MNRPLEGIRIVEIGHMLAGPYCGLLLADLGAEIIKVEPKDGDIGRRISPHQIGLHNAYFASLNRNKKSIVLDLASDFGKAALGGILKTSQALITNLRPSAIKKLGLTYESLKVWNESLVCVALTGYGLEGPYAERPAYDYVIQAMTGIMALTGDPDSAPTKTGYSAVDNSAGIMAALGLLAKIIHGKGGQVDVAMYDVMLSQLNYLAGATLNAGERQERLANSSHPYIVPAQIFKSADGWLTLFITHDKFWQKFCVELGKDEWLTDPRFATMSGRRQNRELVVADISAVMLTASAGDWVRRLAPLGIVVAEIGTLSDALDNDLTLYRNLIVQLGDGSERLRAIGSPIKFSDSEPEYVMPPLLDEHRGDILSGEGR
ncbi:CoA transferase [Paralcaligenes sp. KSB-10]|uniref:CaiB/BaiF CoA transferase family protein n=1 Tax=Paralcaligenes sp. KSB-10 TaxID=2901142 RepID=UPI001E55AA39|nr:CoA transferase [Paralcaligenes sp. KSB-10]UHL63963.1 CoA transferase [Paralcaligenes sp. KSB-10]